MRPGGRTGASIVFTATPPPGTAPEVEERTMGRWRTWLFPLLAMFGIAGLSVILLALLTNIFERKQEARQPFVRMVEVTEDTMDPKVWSQNWPLQYDSYLRTSLPTTTKYGGRGLGASDSSPAPACTVTPRTSRSTAPSARATSRRGSSRPRRCPTAKPAT